MPYTTQLLADASRTAPSSTSTSPTRTHHLFLSLHKFLVGRASPPAKTFTALLYLSTLCCIAGCASMPTIETANELAAALKQQGIAYDSAEAMDFSGMSPAKIDEGLGLTGPNLEVAILRITDDRTYKMTAQSAFLLAIVKDRAPNIPAPPPDLYLSKPFAIVIRFEPQQGQVRAALKKILKEDPAPKP